LNLPVCELEFVTPDVVVVHIAIAIELEVNTDVGVVISEPGWTNVFIDVVLFAIEGDGNKLSFAIDALAFEFDVVPRVARRARTWGTEIDPLHVLAIPDFPNLRLVRALRIPAIPVFADNLVYGELHARRSGGVLHVVIEFQEKVFCGVVAGHAAMIESMRPRSAAADEEARREAVESRASRHLLLHEPFAASSCTGGAPLPAGHFFDFVESGGVANGARQHEKEQSSQEILHSC
jgi:hypothetical protein